jgi:hypothetical protein
VDKERNADGQRRALPDDSMSTDTSESSAPVGMAPLLRAQMAEYAATGLPPAYLPKHDAHPDPDDEDSDP